MSAVVESASSERASVKPTPGSGGDSKTTKEEKNDLSGGAEASSSSKSKPSDSTRASSSKVGTRSRADTVPRSTTFRILSAEVTDAFVKPSSMTMECSVDGSERMGLEHTTDDSKELDRPTDDGDASERVNDALISEHGGHAEDAFLESGSDVVYYKIVVNGKDPGWTLHKRYSQFEALNLSLLNNPTFSKRRVKLPPLPMKHYKWWVDHTARDFLEDWPKSQKRRALLDNYCAQLIQHKVVGQSQEVFNFFSSDRQRSTDSQSTVAVPFQSAATLSGKSYSTSSLFTSVASKRKLSAVINTPYNSTSHSSTTSRRGTIAVTVSCSNHTSSVMGSDESRLAPYSSGDRVSSAMESGVSDSDEQRERTLREVTSITIPKTRLMPDHVLYQVRMENADRYSDGMEAAEEDSTDAHKAGPDQFKVWTLMKRFSNFYELNEQLLDPAFLTSIGLDSAAVRTDVSKGRGELFPILPPRRSKYWCDHKDREFVETRRVLLENYLQRLLSMPQIVTSSVFLKFIGVDLGE